MLREQIHPLYTIYGLLGRMINKRDSPEEVAHWESKKGIELRVRSLVSICPSGDTIMNPTDTDWIGNTPYNKHPNV